MPLRMPVPRILAISIALIIGSYPVDVVTESPGRGKSELHHIIDRDGELLLGTEVPLGHADRGGS